MVNFENMNQVIDMNAQGAYDIITSSGYPIHGSPVRTNYYRLDYDNNEILRSFTRVEIIDPYTNYDCDFISTDELDEIIEVNIRDATLQDLIEED